MQPCSGGVAQLLKELTKWPKKSEPQMSESVEDLLSLGQPWVP